MVGLSDIAPSASGGGPQGPEQPGETDVTTDFKRSARRRDPDLMRLLHLDPGPCSVCGRSDALMHLHHIVPRARGGDDSRENLCWLDADCHRRLHSYQLTPEELDLIRPLRYNDTDD